jgi:uncharacterized membrane protein YoaK (UPF0700 family)
MVVGDGDRGDGHPARGALLLGLTVVAASMDALSYLGLGRVFPANMTGNTVLLGIGLATGDIEAAARSATALGAFVLGAAVVGGALAGRRSSGTDFMIVVVIEIGMIAAFTGWWLRLGVAEPTGAARYGLIALAGTTMGAQSGITRSLRVPVATTYITGTWTTVSMGAAALLRRHAAGGSGAGESSLRLQAFVVAAYLAAAAGAAVAFRFLGAAATAVPLAVLVLLGAVGCIVRAGRNRVGVAR